MVNINRVLQDVSLTDHSALCEAISMLELKHRTLEKHIRAMKKMRAAMKKTMKAAARSAAKKAMKVSKVAKAVKSMKAVPMYAKGGLLYSPI